MIHALLIGESANFRSLNWSEVRAWKPEQGLLWVHLDGGAEESRQWVMTNRHLPSIVPPALLADETRPRCSTIGDGALIVLRGVNLNPGSDPEDMVSIRLWIESRLVISVRLRPLLSIPDVVDSLEQQPLTGTGDLVVRLASRLVDRMGDVIDSMEDRVAELEHAIFGNQIALVGFKGVSCNVKKLLAGILGGDLNCLTAHECRHLGIRSRI